MSKFQIAVVSAMFLLSACKNCDWHLTAAGCDKNCKERYERCQKNSGKDCEQRRERCRDDCEGKFLSPGGHCDG